MDMNPQRVRTAQFKTVKRGLDPDEVQSFLAAVADELERAQNQSTAMEARARAAVARLQELSDDAASQSDANAEIARPVVREEAPAAEPVPTGSSVDVSVDQSETISRTLLLAQRTADTAVAEARAEAQRLREEAEAEAAQAVESSRASAQAMLDEARLEARKAGEDEKVALAGEVDSLMARRDFLESDVEHMEQFLVAQRSRLRDAANEIIELTERIPSGLGESRPPLLSAATDDGDEPAADGDASTDGFGAAGSFESDAGASDDEPIPSFESVVEDDDDDLWLPDDVDEVPTGGSETDASSSDGDEGGGRTLKFGFPRNTD